MKSREGKKSQKKVGPLEKKMRTRKMLGKSRIAVFFKWFVVPEGLKVGVQR